MSTLVSQPVPQPSWKEEVNRRLEAHKSRRGLAIASKPSQEDAHAVSDRAANAAARVAARFAKVPSYSEMQAAEARSALRAAEAATRAALEAQAAAQAALAQLESDPEDSFEYESTAPYQHHASTIEPPAESAVAVFVEEQATQPSADSFAIRWDAEFPSQHSNVAASHARLGSSDPFAEITLGDAEPQEFQEFDYQIVEAAQPIPANLIRFPREIIATRRMRPRISGLPHNIAEDQHGQLSIFEVDPSSVSTEPVAAATSVFSPAPAAAAGAEWSGIRLDAEPAPIADRRPASTAASNIHLAPLELRLMALAVDTALSLALFSAGVYGIARHLDHAMPLRTAQVDGIFGFVLIAFLYQAFFLICTQTTPGMMYAGLSLSTFDDEAPTRVQLRDRLFALLISVVPVGLGVAWSIFDEDHLSWHDRLSRTYTRKN